MNRPQMTPQVGHNIEGSHTNVAHKWLLLAVNQHVLLQFALRGKALSAFITPERFDLEYVAQNLTLQDEDNVVTKYIYIAQNGTKLVMTKMKIYICKEICIKLYQNKCKSYVRPPCCCF